MGLVTRLLACALAVGGLLSWAACLPVEASRPVEVALSGNRFRAQRGDARVETGQDFRPVPPGSMLMTAPVLVPGQPAWVTVRSPTGRRLAGVSVLVNDVPHETDGA